MAHALSDGVVEDENRRCHVRLDLVGAEKREDLPTGQPLDDSSEVGFHLLVEDAARFADVAVPPCLREDLLGLEFAASYISA